MGIRNSKQSMEITAANKKNGELNGKAVHEEVKEEKITVSSPSVTSGGDVKDYTVASCSR
jgi:hypothetical protein